MTNILITDITGDKRRRFALMVIRGRLQIEIKTGMRYSNRLSTITAARGWGYEGPNRKQKCLDWVIEQIGE